MLEGKQFAVYRPRQDPAFFNIFVEKRHADHLANKDLDDESRLEVVYRVLKDQLRKAKKDLLATKKNRDTRLKKALDLKKNMKDAVERDEKGSIADNVIMDVDENGKPIMKFIGSQD